MVLQFAKRKYWGLTYLIQRQSILLPRFHGIYIKMRQERDSTHYYTRHEVHWEDFTLDLRKRVSC